jgi:inorganic pyrophosphatase
MDILVMTTEPTFTGCLIEVRPIGLFRMRDEAGEDEKVLSIPVADPGLSHVRELGDIAPHFLKEVEHFFKIYKDLEGKKVVTVGWDGREASEEAIRAAIASYRTASS